MGFTFIDEQLVRKPIVYPVDFEPRLERSQQWEILETHPYFTGVCPECQNSYPQNIDRERHVHWDCVYEWVDDSVYL